MYRVHKRIKIILFIVIHIKSKSYCLLQYVVNKNTDVDFLHDIDKIDRLSKYMEHIQEAKSYCLLQNVVNYILNAQRT